MSRYTEEIMETERKLNELKKKQEDWDNHPIPVSERLVAETMHKTHCRFSHEDMCDWDYDTGAWNMSSRKRYLEKAREALKLGSHETIIKILTISSKT
jgi:hypothetical protein